MKVWIEVAGDVEVRRALERQGKAGELAARRAFNRITRRIVPLARGLAPTGETGKLARSIRISSARVNPRTGVITASVVAGGAPTKEAGRAMSIYALPQEAGQAAIGAGGAVVQLHHDDGQSPFLLPPFLKEGERAAAELMDELDREVKGAL